MIIKKIKGKLKLNWEDQFIFEKVYSNETYLLTTVEGDRIILRTNTRFLKNYYPPLKYTYIYKGFQVDKDYNSQAQPNINHVPNWRQDS